MVERSANVLILCTGNSARSILAEEILNHRSAGRFKGYSAGSHPKGAVHPLALCVLAERGLPTLGLRSKSWDEFAGPSAPHMDYVFTVCDQAAGEVCPIWPGTPMKAHWGLPDPAAALGSDAEKMAAFNAASATIDARIQHFLALDFAASPRAELQRLVRETANIGAVS